MSIIAKLVKKDYGLSVKIIVGIKNEGEKTKIYNFNTKEMIPIEPFAPIDETLGLEVPDEIYKAIANAIKQDGELPSPKKDYLEGKIESMSEHLSDMRKIVFEETEKK